MIRIFKGVIVNKNMKLILYASEIKKNNEVKMNESDTSYNSLPRQEITQATKSHKGK